MPILEQPDRRRFRRGPRAVVAGIVVIAMLGACSDDDSDDGVTTESPADPVAAAEQRVADAEQGVDAAEETLTSAHSEFCSSSQGYVETLDRYGRLFTDRAATVGDITTLGADLVEPREEVVTAADAVEVAKDDLATAQQELLDAQAALAAAIATASSVPVDTSAPESTTTTTLVPPATIDRVQQAEDDLARVSEGITDDTPLIEAAASYNSAALALQIAWLRLLNEAQCFTSEQQANAAEQLAAYTTALQTDLAAAGYDPGAIDGVYGPQTVAAVEQLQSDSGLPVTGFVDEATARALQDKLAAVGLEQARQTVVLQTILSLAGYWDGPLDGVWTEELTQALRDFQTALGVEPTGVVDAATVVAFQQALANLQAGPPPSTTPAPPTTEPATTVPVTPATVDVADSDLGPILTTGDGMSLYLFTPDAQGAPTCTDACAGTWPPLVVDDAAEVSGADGVDAALLGTVEHPDGTQVTYNGWPLYLFAGDSDPGDITGQAQGGVWFVVDPAGDAVGDE